MDAPYLSVGIHAMFFSFTKMGRGARCVLVIAVLVGGMGAFSPGSAQSDPPETGGARVVVDDFESNTPGEFPDDWVYVSSDEEILSYDEVRDAGEKMVVREEAGNHFLRVETKDAALRYTKRNGVEFDWNLKTHPRLTWRWRAFTLPEGASERGKNDAGGAVYVTFGTDWLGRPKSIKYTYSSSLPVGTVVDFGNLYVIVIGSAREPNTGQWKTVTRNVVQDYRQVFGGKPPKRPVSVTIWSDSDTTHDRARVDFDDIALLKERQ
jgi:hypothetical protein